MFYNSCSILQYELKYDESKPSIIYGAGRYGYILSRIINNVSFFVDADINKIGSKLNGIEVIDIDSLVRMIGDNQLIISVNSRIMYSVLMSLVKRGFKSWCLLHSVLYQKGCMYDQIDELL